jgi:hypothetical protein
MKHAGLLIWTLTIYLIPGGNVSAMDVGFYGILKKQYFTQTSASGPVLLQSEPFAWEAFVEAVEPLVINSSVIQIPGGGSRALNPKDPGEVTWQHRQAATSQLALNNVFGSGTYAFTIDSENDIISLAQLFLPTDAYPNPPTVTNFAATQNINPSRDFTLNWSPFTGTDADDWIDIDVLDAAGNSVGGADLIGSATSLVIPANTLQAEQAYQARIVFVNVTSTDWSSIPGAQGIAGFTSETKLSLLTEGYVRPNAEFQIVRSAGGEMQLEMACTIGKSYTLQWSSNLVGWTNLFTTNASASVITFGQVPNANARFYRALCQ